MLRGFRLGSPKRKVVITLLLQEPWEEWLGEVPDDAPTDPDQLREWVRDNRVDVNNLELRQSGSHGQIVDEVEEL